MRKKQIYGFAKSIDSVVKLTVDKERKYNKIAAIFPFVLEYMRKNEANGQIRVMEEIARLLSTCIKKEEEAEEELDEDGRYPQRVGRK